MTDKDLKKLKRDDFIEIIYEYQRREQALMEENRQLRQQLEERGSITKAAQSLNAALEEAQNAAGQYLHELQNLRRQAEGLPPEPMPEPAPKAEKAQEPEPSQPEETADQGPAYEEHTDYSGNEAYLHHAAYDQALPYDQKPVYEQTAQEPESYSQMAEPSQPEPAAEEADPYSQDFQPSFDLDVLSWDPYDDSGMEEFLQDPEPQAQPEQPQTGSKLDGRWLQTAPQADPKPQKDHDGLMGDYHRLMDKLRRK